MGFFSTFLKAIGLLVVGIFALSCVMVSTQSPTETTMKGAMRIPKEGSSVPLYAFGEPVTMGSFKYTFLNTSRCRMILKSDYAYKETTGVFLLVETTVETIGKETTTLLENDIFVVDTQDRKFDKFTGASVYLYGVFASEGIPPGIPKPGYFVFEVPETLEGALAVTDNNLFSDVTVKYVKLPEPPEVKENCIGRFYR